MEIKERKKILKIIRLLLDKYNHYVVEYIYQGKGKEFLPKKRINKGEIKNGNENWKPHYC